MVLIGGMHGNEPTGPRAIARVLGEISERRAPIAGRLVGLAGNLGALEAGKRYLARDLNRGWTRGEVGELLDPASVRDLPEDHEQRELLRAIVPLLSGARAPVVFLDLHSTSGDSPPFTCLSDVLRNRAVALSFPVPVVLGIEEILDGTILGYLCDLGHVAVAVEGGRSDDPLTQQRHECAIWSTLVAAGSLRRADVADLDEQRGRLREAAGSAPPVVEIRHRHRVREGDAFEMLPGFRSFMPVQRGQVVARDRYGELRCPESGLMLMPRYQGQGEDGYFIARAVSPFWLKLSAWLRYGRLDRLVPLLPGVSRHPTEPDRFLVDRDVARFQVINVFHLLGYRHVREAGERLQFSRRRPRFQPSEALPPELARLAGS